MKPMPSTYAVPKMPKQVILKTGDEYFNTACLAYQVMRAHKLENEVTQETDLEITLNDGRTIILVGEMAIKAWKYLEETLEEYVKNDVVEVR